jgi:UDP-2,3-diacylglucosamine pyrophosphatase LpxH
MSRKWRFAMSTNLVENFCSKSVELVFLSPSGLVLSLLHFRQLLVLSAQCKTQAIYKAQQKLSYRVKQKNNNANYQNVRTNGSTEKRDAFVHSHTHAHNLNNIQKSLTSWYARAFPAWWTFSEWAYTSCLQHKKKRLRIHISTNDKQKRVLKIQTNLCQNAFCVLAQLQLHLFNI